MGAFLRFAATMIGAIAFVSGTIIAVANRLEFPGDSAAIEALRRDAARVCVSQSEDVVGQVTAANQDIARWRAYNGNPLLDIFIPDGWDRIDPIIIADPTSCVPR